MTTSLRDELSQVVAGLRARLQWQQAHGARWVPAAPSPRLAPAAREPAVGPLAPRTTVEEPPPAAPTPAEAVADKPRGSLDEVRARLGRCTRCGLHKTRKNLVFGAGNERADLMFIGEAPGGDEDRQGEPFVGAAGKLLTRMIEAMGLGRDEVYIANIIKCRPPRNRDPEPEEIAACEPFLLQQIDVIQPQIIVALGSFAARTLLRTEQGITHLRGRFHTYHGIPVMPTFHPAYLLRDPARKRPVWEDLKQVMAEMDRLGVERRASSRPRR